MKKVLIVGATGMVGNRVLEYCLDSDDISNVTVITRKPLNLDHPKLKEVMHKDFSSYEDLKNEFQDLDIGFFCIGVYTGSVKDDLLKLITVDFAEAFAKTLYQESPDATFCFLSGAGSDRSEKSRMSFAKYKGIAENLIDDMGFKSWYSFRPGYIYPVTPRKEPSFAYQMVRWMYPVIRLFGDNSSIKSTELAEGMVSVGLNGTEKKILENRDIITYLKSTAG
ncbi:MAG: hypothetical protein AAF502_06495 [Bacteroidota bacterium]